MNTSVVDRDRFHRIRREVVTGLFFVFVSSSWAECRNGENANFYHLLQVGKPEEREKQCENKKIKRFFRFALYDVCPTYPLTFSLPCCHRRCRHGSDESLYLLSFFLLCFSGVFHAFHLLFIRRLLRLFVVCG